MSTVSIPLSQGKFAEIDEEDLPLVGVHRWYTSCRRRQDGREVCYALRRHRDEEGRMRTVYMHREIAGAMPGQDVDHLNSETLDNRRENLRRCSRSQNLANRSSARGTSRFKGVSWNNRRAKWIVQIMVGRRGHYVGQFSDERDAALAYDCAARRYYGEFAHLNFPSESEAA